jgi:hypothetical protein
MLLIWPRQSSNAAIRSNSDGPSERERNWEGDEDGSLWIVPSTTWTQSQSTLIALGVAPKRKINYIRWNKATCNSGIGLHFTLKEE